MPSAATRQDLAEVLHGEEAKPIGWEFEFRAEFTQSGNKAEAKFSYAQPAKLNKESKESEEAKAGEASEEAASGSKISDIKINGLIVLGDFTAKIAYERSGSQGSDTGTYDYRSYVNAAKKAEPENKPEKLTDLEIREREQRAILEKLSPTDRIVVGEIMKQSNLAYLAHLEQTVAEKDGLSQEQLQQQEQQMAVKIALETLVQFTKKQEMMSQLKGRSLSLG